MTETMGLALMAGVVVVILLQAAVLLWGGRHDDGERHFRALQEAQDKGLARLERELREELARGRREDAEESFRDREERAQSANLLGQAVTTQVGQFGALQAERLEAFARELNRFSLGLDERFERLKLSVEGRLTAIQADNASQLEEMRRTVDEKLHATLEQRLGESFKLVSERLEQVHRGLGEMQTLAAGVGDLKRVLTNVKTRGTWGEVQLAALLEQLLTADQFAANVATVPDSNERVDFAIRLPGKDDGAVVWLPIDAKFPIEDYQRLLDAQERIDPAAVEEAAKAIETRLKNEARSIRDKYVAPPHTTDFAMLYLPIEGLYAEALRRPALAETLQRDYRVSLAGPTTLAALLNSLQMGFRTLAIEQRSAEVWAVLGAVKTEFGKFGEALAHTKKKLDEASNSISKAEIRTRQLSRRLKDVEALPVGEAEKLIGVADFEGEDE
ncbi:DNA recombination protein RmuC [Dechloromonas denitrificans]|uniref:DNA recombination protein RmuC n=1 Tax=Dechloromonas denitrificans TaxID=281362 RepID=UPI001CFA445C|nr:DNA recombination protein RmuC [Dechloromonas denitrificans]UCV09734.1 DNA recombination protein RmuC [Dechloromonas denitrificans]